MSPREQAAAIALLQRWLKWLENQQKNPKDVAPSLERLRLVDETKEFLATSNLEDVK